MIIHYIGYGISIVLALCSVILFAVSFYFKIREPFITKSDFNEKSLKVGNFSAILSALCLVLSIFIILTIENGFSWESLLVLLLIFIAFLVYMYMDYAIRKASLNYFRKRSVSVLRDGPLKSVLKNGHVGKKSETDEKKD